MQAVQGGAAFRAPESGSRGYPLARGEGSQHSPTDESRKTKSKKKAVFGKQVPVEDHAPSACQPKHCPCPVSEKFPPAMHISEHRKKFRIRQSDSCTPGPTHDSCENQPCAFRGERGTRNDLSCEF